jgi:hypothetical protein
MRGALNVTRRALVDENDKLHTLIWFRRCMDRLSRIVPPDLPTERLIRERASGDGHSVKIAARIVAEIDNALTDIVSGQRFHRFAYLVSRVRSEQADADVPNMLFAG